MFTLQDLKARAAALEAEIESNKDARVEIVDAAIEGKRALSDDDESRCATLESDAKSLRSQLDSVNERIVDMEKLADLAKRSNAVHGGDGKVQTPEGGARTRDQLVYQQYRADTSYFRDLYQATRKGDPDAGERIRKHHTIEAELRAAGDETVGAVTWTSGAPGIPAGSGGVFAPPAWLVNQFVELARPGRIGVDTFDNMPLPVGVSSINIPKVTTGTAVGYQATELTALPGQSIVTTEVNSGIVTVGGKQVVSLQMLEQSAIPFDNLILGDLARAYAANLDAEALNGTGAAGHLRGLVSAAGIVTIALGATPTAQVIYTAIAQAAAKINAVRFQSPDTILMHPGAWANLLTGVDGSGRPLVSPVAPMNNPASVVGGGFNSAGGVVGNILGMNVVIDPQIPTSGSPVVSNMFVYLANDIKVWENGPRAEAFDAPYAEEAGVLFRILGYAAMIPDRYGSSIVKVTGATVLG